MWLGPICCSAFYQKVFRTSTDGPILPILFNVPCHDGHVSFTTDKFNWIKNNAEITYSRSPSVDGSAGSRSTDPEKKDKDMADTDQMINDEVVEEIKKFKGWFITYADTEIKFTMQSQITQHRTRIDKLYAKFMNMFDIPSTQKDISTINTYIQRLETDKANYENELRGVGKNELESPKYRHKRAIN